eukprot:g934.t1
MRGRLRWASNVSSFDPEEKEKDKEFLELLSLCSDSKEEREKVMRYRRWEDKKRALFSRLLTRCACVSTFRKRKREDIVIKRTKGGKPFLAMNRTEDENRDLPNFNFNVAHDGDWVVLCAEPVLLCGVDVCGRQGPREGTSVREWFELFKDHFSVEEWNWIRCDDNNKEREPKDQLSVFRLLWSCKEAFTKARGDGLACRLRRCTFRRRDIEKKKENTLKTFYRLMLRFDNVERRDWDFVSMLLSDDHWITVSRASPSEAIDAYGEFKRTFSRVDVGICDDDDDDDVDLCDDKDKKSPSMKFRILKANDFRSILQME